MPGTILKSHLSETDLAFDWSGLLAKGETIVADAGWTVTPEPDGAGADIWPVLAATGLAHDSYRSVALLSDGWPGRVYIVTGRVQTDAGRVLAQSCAVRIAAEVVQCSAA